MNSYRHPHVGDHIVYHDPKGQPHEALVTAVWDGGREDPANPPCLNLAHVSGDQGEQDDCGRKIEAVTSVIHKTSIDTHG